MTSDLQSIEKFLKKYLSEEPRKDSEFRYAIATNQFGSLGSHMTHDPVLNPQARAYQTKAGEKGDFGHALLQLMVYGISRGLPLEESIFIAMTGLEDKTWMARVPESKGEIRGKIACDALFDKYGVICGISHVDPFCIHLEKMCHGEILVISHASACDITPFIHKVGGIVTDQGGMSCHAAIIARENNIPCIVDTGDATKRIARGEFITMRNDGTVEIGADRGM